MTSSWKKVKVSDSNMRAYVSLPENPRPAPAIIVVQGQTGVDDFVQFSDMVSRKDLSPRRRISITAIGRTARTTGRRAECACAIRR